jgi:hypothetical protein
MIFNSSTLETSCAAMSEKSSFFKHFLIFFKPADLVLCFFYVRILSLILVTFSSLGTEVNSWEIF